jgi:hypothetical protein
LLKGKRQNYDIIGPPRPYTKHNAMKNQFDI